MLEGKCPRCGFACSGWALLSPRYQTCPNCGIGLDITEDGKPVMRGFSPFTADRMDTKPRADKVPKADRKATDKDKPPK